MLTLIAGIGAAAFAVRLYWSIGTSWMNMQFCFFASYVALYVLGVRSFRSGWFETMSRTSGLRWLTLGLGVGIPLWIAVLIGGGALEHGDALVKGGFTWQAAAYALWEAFVAVALSAGVCAFFFRYMHRETRFSKVLADNSFSVFIFHAPVLVCLTWLFSGLPVVPPLKAILVGSLAFTLSLAFAAVVIRRLPGIRRVF